MQVQSGDLMPAISGEFEYENSGLVREDIFFGFFCFYCLLVVDARVGCERFEVALPHRRVYPWSSQGAAETAGD